MLLNKTQIFTPAIAHTKYMHTVVRCVSKLYDFQQLEQTYDFCCLSVCDFVDISIVLIDDTGRRSS